MKAYGKTRRLCAKRTIPGTRRDCPCCIPREGHRAGKDLKKKARRLAKEEAVA